MSAWSFFFFFDLHSFSALTGRCKLAEHSPELAGSLGFAGSERYAW